MQIVDKYIQSIMDEVDGACDYAENYVINKKSNPQWAKMYHEMATDELKHAQYMYDMSENHIKQLQSVYDNSDDSSAWENLMKKYVEKTAMVKHILTM